MIEIWELQNDLVAGWSFVPFANMSGLHAADMHKIDLPQEIWSRKVRRRFGINTDPAALASVLLEQSAFRGPMHPPLQVSSAIPALPWPSNTTFEVFTRASPNNSLERLTERSVGLVTDRPSNVYELLVTLFE